MSPCLPRWPTWDGAALKMPIWVVRLYLLALKEDDMLQSIIRRARITTARPSHNGNACSL